MLFSLQRLSVAAMMLAVSVCWTHSAIAQSRTIEVAVIETDHGEMVIQFWDDVAPETVENFKKLAGDEFYDNTAFHRIIDGFMIQGGDPLTRDDSLKDRWGTGDPGSKIDAEFNDRKHVRGVISMARGRDVNSAGCQFFICLDDAEFLDGKYTAFGQLIAGDDVLEKLAKTPVEDNGHGEISSPIEKTNLQSIRIEQRQIDDN